MPLSAGTLAIGAGARFFARSVDTLQKHLPEVLKRARAHRGASLVEIFQNCIVYNDDVFGGFTGREVADDTQLHAHVPAPEAVKRDLNGLLRRGHTWTVAG